MEKTNNINIKGGINYAKENLKQEERPEQVQKNSDDNKESQHSSTKRRTQTINEKIPLYYIEQIRIEKNEQTLTALMTLTQVRMKQSERLGAIKEFLETALKKLKIKKVIIKIEERYIFNLDASITEKPEEEIQKWEILSK